MEPVLSSETSADLHQTTRRHIIENSAFHIHCHQNLKDKISFSFLSICICSSFGLFYLPFFPFFLAITRLLVFSYGWMDDGLLVSSLICLFVGSFTPSAGSTVQTSTPAFSPSSKSLIGLRLLYIHKLIILSRV
jgi:hypothetical protein